MNYLEASQHIELMLMDASNAFQEIKGSGEDDYLYFLAKIRLHVLNTLLETGMDVFHVAQEKIGKKDVWKLFVLAVNLPKHAGKDELAICLKLLADADQNALEQVLSMHSHKLLSLNEVRLSA